MEPPSGEEHRIEVDAEDDLDWVNLVCPKEPEEAKKFIEMINTKLDNKIFAIDQHFKNTLNSHEKNFIKAYKGQMLKVEKELRFLKGKQAEQAGKLMKDDDITNLQTSIAWFKSEAVKLNEILDNQKYQMQTIKYRLKHDSKEHQFMLESLKETRRQNKLMQLATEKTEEQNKALDAFFAANETDGDGNYDPAQDLPQTTDEFLEFDKFYKDSNELDLVPLIKKLILTRHADAVDEKVIKFFESFDRLQLQ